MLFRVVAIQVHLAYVGMGQRAELQVDDDQAAQLAMEEQQIDAIPSLVDAQTSLPPDEGKAIAQLRQEVLRPPNQGLFEVGLGIFVLEVEELKHIRVFDRIGGRDGIFRLDRKSTRLNSSH